VQCAVLFLDVVRYSEQPFADQVEIKQRINAAVLEATRHLTPDDRILLDTGDGVAISFQSNPEDALFVALSLGQALGAPANGQAVAIRTGINFGKVSVLRDLNGQPSVIGDGINMAQRVMSFANPGQLLISRAFYQVLVAQSEDYAAMFTYCGSRTDKHVREHELFEFATPLRDMGQLALPAVMVSARARAIQALPPPLKSAGTSGRPRTALRMTVAALFVVMALVIMTQIWREPSRQATPAAAVVAAAPAPPPAGRPAASPAKRPRPARPQRPRAEEPAPPSPAPEVTLAEPVDTDSPPEVAPPPPPLASATLAFTVSPWGEVVVDGQSYGATPPLTHLPLPPGEHRVEIRNGVSDPYRTLVRIEPDQVLRIQHRFEPQRRPE
jgi:hypothetical protein